MSTEAWLQLSLSSKKALQDLSAPLTISSSPTLNAPLSMSSPLPISVPLPRPNTSPLVVSGSPVLGPRPIPLVSPLVALTNDQIQSRAKEMLAQGIDRIIIANFIKAQQSIQFQLLQQKELLASRQAPPPKFQYHGVYQPKSPSGLYICYECRFEIGEEDSALTVAKRFYHSTCFHCGKCRKDISKLDFFPVTDQMYCTSCYEEYSRQ